MYQQLLQRVGAAITGGPSHGPVVSVVSYPFLAILQSVRDADTIPPYMREAYPYVVYWTKSEYLEDHQNNHGALCTFRAPDSGPIGFLETEEGIVLSQEAQQQCCDYAKPLLYTLLAHNLAPSSWAKCTSLAREFFVRSMRMKFPIFRLCLDDWKADTFMSAYYLQWEDRPGRAEMPSMGEEGDTDPSLTANSSRVNSSARKRPQSTSLASFSPQPGRRKKEESLDVDIYPSFHGDINFNDKIPCTGSTGTDAALNESGLPSIAVRVHYSLFH